eukprot:g7204.t1
MHIYPKRASLDGLEIEIFKLVSYSATPKQWKEWLRVPLEHAAARGNLDLFNKLLRAGADGSAGWRGCRDRTMLDAAAVGGNEDVVTGLLQAGAMPDVNVVSCSSRRSALYKAIMLGHETVARRLVFAGADVHFHSPIEGSTVLGAAIRGGLGQLAKDLLLAGASSGEIDERGSTLLHIAAANGSGAIVSDLLIKGADKDAQDPMGISPLMLAARNGHLSAAKTLLDSGANSNLRSRRFPPRSALDWAAEKGHVCVLQALLDHVANVDARDTFGWTALHVAATFNQVGAIHALLDAGADIEAQSYNELRPLSMACWDTRHETMLALLQRGATVNTRDPHGRTSLHQVCFNPKPGVRTGVDLLLRWGADETALDNGGHTVPKMLELCSSFEASANEVENVRLLLARAPADRAWRRRGWLVMLRSRSTEGRTTAGCGVGCPSDEEGGEGPNGTGGREGEGRKVTRTGHAGRSDGGAKEDVLDLSRVVTLLIGLEAEGVFRTVVGFL